MLLWFSGDAVGELGVQALVVYCLDGVLMPRHASWGCVLPATCVCSRTCGVVLCVPCAMIIDSDAIKHFFRAQQHFQHKFVCSSRRLLGLQHPVVWGNAPLCSPLPLVFGRIQDITTIIIIMCMDIHARSLKPSKKLVGCVGVCLLLHAKKLLDFWLGQKNG